MECVVVKVGNVIEWEMICVTSETNEKGAKVGRKRCKYLINLLTET